MTDHEKVGMDLDSIKAIYDERFKGNQSALEDYVVRRLTEEAFEEKPLRVAVPKGYKVIFEKDDDGHIIDMRFDRIH